MVYSEKLLNIIALMKCEDHPNTKKLTTVLPYKCLYLNKGINSSVQGSILTKLIGYRETMVLIISADGMDGQHQNYIPPTLSGDKNMQR